MPEAPALELVEGDLDDPLRPQRHEAHVFARAEARPVGLGVLDVAVGVATHERLELVDELEATLRGEGGDAPDVEELPVLVQPEQQRADALAGLVHAISGDDRLGRALVLDLEHRALAGGVGRGEGLRDDPVEPGPLEAGEPVGRLGGVAGHPREVQRCSLRHALEERLEPLPPLGEGRARHVLVAEGEQVEGDELGRRLLRELGDPRLGGMDALAEGLPVEALGARLATAHDHLAVDDGAARQVLDDRCHELGEVAGQRLLAAADELDVVALLAHDAPEAVPLGLVGVATLHGIRRRHIRDGLGEHRVEHEVSGKWCHSPHSAREPRHLRR